MENKTDNEASKQSVKNLINENQLVTEELPMQNNDDEEILEDNNIQQTDDDDDDEIINNNIEDDNPVIVNKGNNNINEDAKGILNHKENEVLENRSNNVRENHFEVNITLNSNNDKEEIKLSNQNTILPNTQDEISNNNKEEMIEPIEEIIPILSESISKLTHTKEEIIQYLTGKYNHSNSDISDISYDKWVSKDNNMQGLCKEIEIPLRMKFNKLLDSHHLDCEFKLLKWITQDKDHRNKLLSLSEEEINLNRFPHIIPYEFNRITLKRKEDGVQYINASYIDGPFESDRRLFIATQNPLLNTIDHFVELVINENVRVIIMLSGEYEENRYKGESYLPTEQNKAKQIGNKVIELLEEPITLIEKGVTLRKLQMTNKETKATAQIDHYLVSCWDDHSIPRQEIEKTLLNILFDAVNAFSSKSPCIVHCLNGIGRTGAFIALYNINKCINEQKKLKFEVPIINVFNVVRRLREQRIGMVIDFVLYRYIYKIALEFNKTFYDEE